jgi:hypothetical protein
MGGMDRISASGGQNGPSIPGALGVGTRRYPLGTHGEARSMARNPIPIQFEGRILSRKG